MPVRQEFSLPSTDGVHTLHGVLWLPDGPVRGVVQLTHGISEYILRYDPFARYLAEAGFAVGGHDHLGHGQTAQNPEEYGWFAPKDGWRYVCEDAFSVGEHLKSRFPALPFFLLGHSMGSFVARTLLIDHPGTTDGAILSGTGQEPGALVAGGRLLADLACRIRGTRDRSQLIYNLSIGSYNAKFKPTRTSADWISRDEAVVDAYLADPLCSFITSAGMFRDMMEGLAYIAKPANLARMDPDTPVYFFSGDRDPVGAMGKGVELVAGFFRKAGCRRVEVKLWPEGRHEMLNEINRQEVFRDVQSWLEARLAEGKKED